MVKMIIRITVLIFAASMIFPIFSEGSNRAASPESYEPYGVGAVTVGLWGGWPGGTLQGGKQTSLLLKIYAGGYLNPYFYLGTYGNLSPGVKYGNHPDGSAFMAELGTIFGTRIFINKKTEVLLAGELGYRRQMSTSIEEIDTWGLGVNLNIGINLEINENLSVQINPGFLSQPYGTDAATESWYEGYPPIFYLAGGISFGLEDVMSSLFGSR